MNRFRNSVLTLTILFVSLSYGCTSYKIPPVGGNVLSNKVSLNLDESTIFFSGVNFDLQNQHKKAFISALSYMTQLKRNTEGDKINISAIKIDSRTRTGVGGPVIMAILSTPYYYHFRYYQMAVQLTSTYHMSSLKKMVQKSKGLSVILSVVLILGGHLLDFRLGKKLKTTFRLRCQS